MGSSYAYLSGHLFTEKTLCVVGIGIPIINLRWPSDRLRFLMEIPIPVRQYLFSE